MPAATNAALLDYETNIEDALATYLTSAISSTQILTMRTLLSSSGVLSTPRVTINVAVTGTNPNQQTNRSTDQAEYDSHKLATLTLACTARRDAAGQSLGTLRGKVRVAMLKASAALNGTSLPYYQTLLVREGSSQLSSDAVNDEITHQLSYALEFWIKPDQWAES